jgi:RNA polymerase sigma factor (sigma-70 family)
MEINTENSVSQRDEELVGRIVKGEKRLYEQLMRKYNQRLYRISRSIVNDDAAAQDIMQTAYLNAYLHLADFQTKSSFATWLTQILINESLLYKKRGQKYQEVLTNNEKNPIHHQTPLSELMNNELKTILEQSVSGLPEKYRLVFVMREMEDMSVNETMEVLHLSESNVKVRLNRAKEMLRTNLSSHYKNSDVYHFHLTRCDSVVKYVMAQIDQMGNYQLAN